MSDPRPIGVFDSGIGGLTVLRALQARLPHENFIYLGDTARVPYGTKGAATVVQFTGQALDELIQRGVKQAVIACNTSTALALDIVRSEHDLPIHGVIEPGVEAALAATRGRIGVIGTLATIGSGKYQEELSRRRSDLRVESRACPLFVPLAEEGLVEGPIPAGIVKHYLHDLSQIDTLILGCTHYPILKAAIAEQMGPAVQLVDSALVLAEAVAQDLQSQGQAADRTEAGTLQLLVSDVPQRFQQLSEIFLERELPPVETVDLEAPTERKPS